MKPRRENGRVLVGRAGRFTRRRALLALLAGCSAACVPFRPGGRRAPGATPADLADSLGDREAAMRLGTAYLAAHPAENGIEGLLDAIDAALEAVRRTSGAEPLPALLSRAVRDDFRHARVVSVEGWLLSRTEARVYALVALGVGRSAVSQT